MLSLIKLTKKNKNNFFLKVPPFKKFLTNEPPKLISNGKVLEAPKYQISSQSEQRFSSYRLTTEK